MKSLPRVRGPGVMGWQRNTSPPAGILCRGRLTSPECGESRCSHGASRLNLRLGPSTVCANSYGRIDHSAKPWILSSSNARLIDHVAFADEDIALFAGHIVNVEIAHVGFGLLAAQQ